MEKALTFLTLQIKIKSPRFVSHQVRMLIKLFPQLEIHSIEVFGVA